MTMAEGARRVTDSTAWKVMVLASGLIICYYAKSLVSDLAQVKAQSFAATARLDSHDLLLKFAQQGQEEIKQELRDMNRKLDRISTSDRIRP